MLRRTVLLVVVGLVMVTAPPSPPASAAGLASAAQPPDVDQVDQQVAEAAAILEYATEQAQAAAADYAAADAALPAAQVRADEARGEVIAARVRAKTAERAADRAADELTIAGARYDKAVKTLDAARDEVAEFAIAAYKGGRLAGVNLMLRADGPAEAVTRLGYIDQVAEIEQAAIDELALARLAARQAENEASVAHDEAESTQRATADALVAAEVAVAEAEAAAGEAADLVEAKAEALEIAEAERDETLRQYEEAEAEAERVEAELREWEASQSALDTPAATGGPSAPAQGFVLPTRGWQSSAYGMRYDPFYAVWQLHAGVDIAAPGGTPIYAAEDGTVIRAGWNGGYGNYTCLGHGDRDGQGLSTCYAHQSEILVEEGQRVDRGEVIGKVGTTGASTGDHLHFEVRLDGSPTDPIPYLPSF